jgi:hypothetical protein
MRNTACVAPIAVVGPDIIALRAMMEEQACREFSWDATLSA